MACYWYRIKVVRQLVVFWVGGRSTVSATSTWFHHSSIIHLLACPRRGGGRARAGAGRCFLFTYSLYLPFYVQFVRKRPRILIDTHNPSNLLDKTVVCG